MRKTWNDEQLIDAVKSSDSMSEVLRKLNLCLTGGSRNTVKRRASILGITLPDGRNSAALQKRIDNLRKPQRPQEEILCKESKAAKSTVKKLLLKTGSVPHLCRACGLKNEWNGKGLVLQLEHINGITNDNRVENLCWLCPNCHSQTDTYCGRNTGKWKDGHKIDRRFGKGRERLQSRRVDYKDVMRVVFDLKNFQKTGKLFGISDTMVRKIVRKHIGMAPKRGQWDTAQKLWRDLVESSSQITKLGWPDKMSIKS